MSRTDTAIRVISAPPDRVYAALTDPDALAVWLPPDEMTGRFEHFDARPGGSYRLVLTYAAASAARGKSAADSDVIDARFVEIVPGMRVVQQIEFVSEGPRRSHEFTLAGCSATVAVKVLWILQERDRCSFGISILRIRNLLKSARDAATLFEVLFEVAPSNEHVAKLLRMTLSLLRQQRALLEGIDPTESDRWGPDVLERFPSVHGTRSRNIVIDWSAVGCGWLRRLGKTWALETLPHYEKLRPMLSDYPQLWELQTILAFCRSAGHMGDVPGAFVLTTSHLKSRPTDRRRDDDPGKALPDQVVDILDRNLKSAAACDDRAIPHPRLVKRRLRVDAAKFEGILAKMTTNLERLDGEERGCARCRDRHHPPRPPPAGTPSASSRSCSPSRGQRCTERSPATEPARRPDPALALRVSFGSPAW